MKNKLGFGLLIILYFNLVELKAQIPVIICDEFKSVCDSFDINRCSDSSYVNYIILDQIALDRKNYDYKSIFSRVKNNKYISIEFDNTNNIKINEVLRVFSNLHCLSLNVSNTKVKFPSNLQNSLKEIEFSLSKYPVDKTFFRLKNLEVIYLGLYSKNIIDFDFNNFLNLKSLTIIFDTIKYIKINGLYNLPNLKYFQFYGSENTLILPTLPPSFCCPNLIELITPPVKAYCPEVKVLKNVKTLPDAYCKNGFILPDEIMYCDSLEGICFQAIAKNIENIQVLNKLSNLKYITLSFDSSVSKETINLVLKQFDHVKLENLYIFFNGSENKLSEMDYNFKQIDNITIPMFSKPNLDKFKNCQQKIFTEVKH